jgi:transcriptional regulator with GAF, ATPase, and Fis domain
MWPRRSAGLAGVTLEALEIGAGELGGGAGPGIELGARQRVLRDRAGGLAARHVNAGFADDAAPQATYRRSVTGDHLGKITMRMTSTMELGDVLAAITRGLVDELDAALARVWLLASGVLHLAASAGLSERLDGAHARVAVGARKIGQIVEANQPLYLDDVAREPRITDKAWVAAHGIVAFAGYPLAVRGEVLGVLAMFSRRLLAPDELERLGMFAAQASVAIANARLFEQVTRLSRRLEAENAYLRDELRRPILGSSPALAKAVHELAQVAPTSSTVLLLGETGTGKELFARAIHEASPRKHRALVAVNCAAIAPALFESELFGHEKGAFTGAVQRRLGRFELAHGGTLFLDEIGELAPEAQAKLLRVIQEQTFERVGGTEPITVDVRIIAATNRDLAAEVRDQRFRADLFYRLSVFPIHIPPLRDRREDLPALLRGQAIEPEAMRYLQAYDWPGNVRELRNVIERAAILAGGAPIRVADLPELRGSSEPRAASDSLKANVEAYERTLIVDAMAAAGGNQSEAARLLRTSRATLQYKLKAYGL